MTPVIYDLMRDYARFDLTQAEAQTIIAKRFQNRMDGAIRGEPTHIMFHIQAGNTRGSLRYWLGKSASSTVMIQHDGSILRVIPEEHGPWTNGDDYAPTPAGLALVNQPGNSNIWTLSIEAEGQSGSDTTPAQLDAIEWQARDWMKRYPKTALPGHQLRHADVQQIERPNCPGAYYPIIMERLKKQGTVYAEPYAIDWKRGDVGLGKLGPAAKVRKMTVELTAVRDTQPRQSASAKAPRTGPEIKQGAKVVAIGTLLVPNGKRVEQWHVLENLARVPASAFEPRLPKP